MTPTLVVGTNRLTQVLDSVGPNVKKVLEDEMKFIGMSIAAEARDFAEAHIHSIGRSKDGKFPPGSYVQSIKGGLAKPKSPTRTTGYTRSGHPLAHLMELGFNITDMIIRPGTTKRTLSHLGALMAFDGGAEELVKRLVHRHATRVPPHPAIKPAYQQFIPSIYAAFDMAKKAAADGAHK